MILQPIDFVVYAWLLMALLSAGYVAYDQFANNPEARHVEQQRRAGCGRADPPHRVSS